MMICEIDGSVDDLLHGCLLCFQAVHLYIVEVVCKLCVVYILVCGGAPMCVYVCLFRVISLDKILYFINTCIIVVITWLRAC